MTSAAFAARLGRSYYHKVTAFHPLPDGGEREICRNVPCALSRAAQVSAPTPPQKAGPLPEADYRLTLFTGPETQFELGDRLEILDDGRTYHGLASDSFSYPTHCLTVVEIGQVSRQTERSIR